MEPAGRLGHELPQSVAKVEAAEVVFAFEVDSSGSFERASKQIDAPTCFWLTTSAGVVVTAAGCTLARYVAAW